MTPYLPGANLDRTLQRLRLPVLAAGVLLLAASVAGAFFSPNDFFRGYLIGWLFLLAVALGSMALLMVQYLTGGAWGIVTRRTFEAASRTIPVIAVLFIPIGFGIGSLYEWARPASVRGDKVLEHRSGYMNPAFFYGRTAAYLITWMILAWLLNKWSAEQDESPGDQQRRLARLSAGGLILYGFSISFASVDWAESLETRWASDIWGFMFMGAEGVVAIGFAIVVLALLSRREPMASALKPDHFHDLGKMLFASLMLWSYFTFCQFLIVWSENLVKEIHYYLPRVNTSWGWFGVALIVAQFLVPVLILLNRALKRQPLILAGIAAFILLMHYMDLIWIVLPAYYKGGFRIEWMQVLAPLGLAGIWLFVFLRELPRRPLLPVNAPALEVALAHQSQ